MAKLKVLMCPAHYLIDDRSHGSEYVWPVGLMRACAAAGDAEFVAIAGQIGSGLTIPGTRTISLGFELSSRERVVGTAWFVAQYTKVALQVIRSWRPDVIHHLLPFRVGATFNPIILGQRSAMTVIGPVQASHRVFLGDEVGVSSGNYGAVERRTAQKRPLSWQAAEVVARCLSAWTLKRATTVLAVNQAGRREVLQASGAKADILPFGVDTSRFAPVTRADAGHHVTNFLVVSYLVTRKRVSDAIKAFGLVVSRRSDAVLRIIGDGPAREELMALARSLRLGNACEFRGRVPHEQIAEEYGRADVLVSASASETFGMSLLEAMASGLPVISTLNDGALEIVEHGETGYLISVGDIYELAERMNEFCSEPASVRRMGQAARTRARERFAWGVIAGQVVGHYASGVNGISR
jgi:glycosyltransferase involved in cell wall biosynthesis